MKRFILLTFAFLAWGYYELSGGPDFQPETRMSALRETAPEPDMVTRSARSPATETLVPLGVNPAAENPARENPVEAGEMPQIELAQIGAGTEGEAVTQARFVRVPEAAPQRTTETPALAEPALGDAASEASPAAVPAAAAAPATASSSASSSNALVPPDPLWTSAASAIAEATEPGPQAPSATPAAIPGAAPGTGPGTGGAADQPVEQPAAPGVAWVNGDRVNLRIGPGTEFGILTQLDTGEAVTVIDRSDGWAMIELDTGVSGWMADWLLDGL